MPTLGQFQFKVSCFGSHGTPSSFSALMDVIFASQKRVVSFANDHKTHKKDLARIFATLRQENLKLNPEKCIFGAPEVETSDSTSPAKASA